MKVRKERTGGEHPCEELSPVADDGSIADDVAVVAEGGNHQKAQHRRNVLLSVIGN
jgi:hypothetical protein